MEYSQADLEAMLSSVLLADEQKKHIPALAALLVDVMNRKLSPGIVQTHISEQFGAGFSVALATGENAIAVGRDNNGIIISIKMPTLPDAEEVKKRTLEAALKRFTEMPVDTLPPHAALPLHSRMERIPNPLFVGRIADLLALAKIIKGDGTTSAAVVSGNTQKVAASTGIGGIGKTQLANEFVHRYGQFFAGGVFWLSFTDPSSIAAEVVVCGGPDGLNLPGFDTFSPENKVAAVKAAWREPIPRLLVFDNCEDERLLRQWRPATGGCRILVTSRNAEWSMGLGVKLLPLHVLEREESVALLRTFRDDLPQDDPDLHAIAQELGDLPLALHLAGCYLKRYQYELTPGEYLARLRSPPLLLLNDVSLQRGDISPTDHEQNVERTFRMSYDRLVPMSHEDRNAQASLARAAHLASGELIPRPLLRTALYPIPGPPEDALHAADAFRRLIELGLLEFEATKHGALRLHRLLAVFTRNAIAPTMDQEAQMGVERAVLRLMRVPEELEPTYTLTSIQLHLRTVMNEAIDKYIAENNYNKAVDMQLKLDPYLLQWGAYRVIVYQHERVQNKLSYPALHLASLVDMGGAYTSLGEHEKALQVYHAALPIARELGNRENVGAVILLLGVQYQMSGKIPDAIQHYDQALTIAQEQNDKNLEAKSLLNLGTCYDMLGKTPDAIDRYQQVQRIVAAYPEQNIAEDVSIQCQFNLGICYATQGQTREALNVFYEVLTFAKSNGYKQMEAQSSGCIGDCYTGLRSEQAYPYLQQALALCQEYELQFCLGDVLHSMAEWLIDQGRYEDAIRRATEGVQVGEKIQNPLFVCRNHTALARAYLSLGDLSSAHSAAYVAQDVDVPLEKHYALVLLGVIEYRQGQVKAAIATFERALQQAALLLDYNPQNYRAWDTQGIGLYGLACSGARQQDGLLAARAAYQKARLLNSDAGVVRRIDCLFTLLGPPSVII